MVVPRNPYQAKGLLLASIRSPDPVIFFEPKRLYNGPFDGHSGGALSSWGKHPKGEVPEGHYTVPIGKADVVREGNAVTIVTYGTLVLVAQAAAEKAGEGRGVRITGILYRGCSAQDATGFIHPSIERKDRSINSLPML